MSKNYSVPQRDEKPSMADLVLGEINWFGGVNGKTGLNNDYGFIIGSRGDVFVHKKQCLSPLEDFKPGAKVVFHEIEGKNGKPSATSVQLLSSLSDEHAISILENSKHLSSEDVLNVAIFRERISPCEKIVLEAVSSLSSSSTPSKILYEFWRKFPPESPLDPFYPYAPNFFKNDVCRRYYSEFIDSLDKLFSSTLEIVTSRDAKTTYESLSEQDKKIAAVWAGRDDAFDAVQAKMLSARAAEKAATYFYESVGLSVHDVSIKQLEGGGGDWTTHDLLIDSSEAVDVKNSRRPVNGKKIYVEHTVPRYKLDRVGAHVRIAGVLSPYLKLSYIKKPSEAPFPIDDLIFLGETSRESIDRIVSIFQSPTFEVVRGDGRMVPHWLFNYPKVWYKKFNEDLCRFADECEWPEEGNWKYTLSDKARTTAIPALCVAEKTLPSDLKEDLFPWQLDFFEKLKKNLAGSPNLPIIFLTVLTDFLEKIQSDYQKFTPVGYEIMLYPSGILDFPKKFYPLGAIDPLGIVKELIETLSTLWIHRDKADLASFQNFRFVGVGMLQGRRRNQSMWNTIIAYCGGTVYKLDADRNVILDAYGKPVSESGKCGAYPLIVGSSSNCADCGKLLCGKCGFCSKPCQDLRFARIAEERRSGARSPGKNRALNNYGWTTEPPKWEEIPDEAYLGDLRYQWSK